MAVTRKMKDITEADVASIRKALIDGEFNVEECRKAGSDEYSVVVIAQGVGIVRHETHKAMAGYLALMGYFIEIIAPGALFVCMESTGAPTTFIDGWKIDPPCANTQAMT